MKNKSAKVFKHILANPFFQHWAEMSKEDSVHLLNLLKAEAVNQAITGIKIDMKAQKTESASLDTFLAENLILGINKVIENIQKIAFVVLLRADENEVLLETVLLLCRNLGISYICANFEVVYSGFAEITRIQRLACFALPKLHTFPQTFTLLNSFSSRYHQKRLLPVKIISKQIEKPIKTPQKKA